MKNGGKMKKNPGPENSRWNRPLKAAEYGQ